MKYPIRYMISDEHKFAYFIVPKVACTSIKHALLPLLSLDVTDENLVREDLTSEVHKFINNSAHLVWKGRYLATLDDHRDHFKFAFVRNPWDRLVSCYLEKLAPGGRGMKHYEYGDVALYDKMPFAEFAEAVCAIPDGEANPHFRSQRAVVCGCGDEVIADFVGRFENLVEDFSHVVKAIGAPSLCLPHLTPSHSRKGRPYREFYDARLARLVGERYSADAAIFGYSF